MPIEAQRFIRKMRGGAQAHLLACSDGHAYVVKFLNNPQHRRILVNEWMAAAFLNYLHISTPSAGLVNLSSDFLAENPDIYIQLGSRRIPIEPGWHFGSRYPGDPAKVTVYDFIPDILLDKVANLEEFRGILVFDKWVGHADSRQAIFFRARIEQWSPAAPRPQRAGFAAWMMDHGYAFNGPHWTFCDSPLQGLYFRSSVYHSVRSLDDFEPWLDRVLHFPDEIMDRAWKQIPPGWLTDEDYTALEGLLSKLIRRRRLVPDLIADVRHGRVNPFPEWR